LTVLAAPKFDQTKRGTASMMGVRPSPPRYEARSQAFIVGRWGFE